MRGWVVIAMTTLVSMFSASPGVATSCVGDPDALTVRQMIVRGTTGDSSFSILVLGRVAAIRNAGDGPYGDQLAVVRVRNSPVGGTAARVRVRFRTVEPPGTLPPGMKELHIGERWVLVLHRRDDATFMFDRLCGKSQQVTRNTLHDLLRLAHSLGLD